jgi:hypothetical protein
LLTLLEDVGDDDVGPIEIGIRVLDHEDQEVAPRVGGRTQVPAASRTVLIPLNLNLILVPGDYFFEVKVGELERRVGFQVVAPPKKKKAGKAQKNDV